VKYLFLLLLSSLCADQLELGKIVIDVEIADNDATRSKGLSGRNFLPEGTGMLFVFDRPNHCSFWMKDTNVALSIGFFDSDKTLLQWVDMPPHEAKSEPHSIYRSSRPALYALEVPMGWFRKNQIQAGEKFRWVNSEK